MMDHDMSIEAQPIRPQEPQPTGSELQRELDRLSLDQALRDFDVANARVVDLTQRLIGAGQELLRARDELETLRREHEELRVAHEGMQRSRAFKMASRVAALRKAF